MRFLGKDRWPLSGDEADFRFLSPGDDPGEDGESSSLWMDLRHCDEFSEIPGVEGDAVSGL